MAGLYLTGSRKAAYFKKVAVDVVADISNYGRKDYLKNERIDAKKGKAYDSRLQMPATNSSGPKGSPETLPARGIHGRRSYTGTGSIPRVVVGITHRLITAPNLYNTY